jgi:hypothetical protein
MNQPIAPIQTVEPHDRRVAPMRDNMVSRLESLCDEIVKLKASAADPV